MLLCERGTKWKIKDRLRGYSRIVINMCINIQLHQLRLRSWLRFVSFNWSARILEDVSININRIQYSKMKQKYVCTSRRACHVICGCIKLGIINFPPSKLTFSVFFFFSLFLLSVRLFDIIRIGICRQWRSLEQRRKLICGNKLCNCCYVKGDCDLYT